MKRCVYRVAILGLVLSSFSITISENLMLKDPNWWKEFVYDKNAQIIINPPPGATNLATVEEPSLLPNEQKLTWFEKNKEQIWYWGALTVTGYSGYLFGKWWGNRGTNNKIKLLEKRLQLADEQEEIPVINDTVRQIVHIETKLNEDANADLKQAIDRGDMRAARRLIDRDKRLDPLVQNFDEAHSILAAIKAEYVCMSCMEIITNANLFQVGSERCFHFICAKCKREWAATGRSGGHACPACRVAS